MAPIVLALGAHTRPEHGAFWLFYTLVS